ncbi:hypothetical protein NL676_003735 [Syzygium grande]|nr:hypothetical protein NL676_003735 [Syzygium grande]
MVARSSSMKMKFQNGITEPHIKAAGRKRKAEAAAEAYAKRLVIYDPYSAVRTMVIDDQSDHYKIEGNSWLSKEMRRIS